MKYLKFISLFVFSIFVLSCNNDENEDATESLNEVSIIDNWIIFEITYDGNHINWGECGHLEEITFYEDLTYDWQLYGIDDLGVNCLPLPTATSTWEQIDNNTVIMLDDMDNPFPVTFNQTHLYMNFIIQASDENPDGIEIRFVFLRS